MIKKEAEKILKYKDLTIEIQRMWKVILVIIGTTGTISKSFRKYVSNIPRKHEVKELQKTAILSTAHILRKVKKKVKVKFSRYRPGVAQRVGRDIALLFHDRDTRRG